MHKVKKEDWRIHLKAEGTGVDLSTLHPGKVAQALRAEHFYRNARAVFVSPAPLLSQIRINVLLDGKELIMPGPGLKDGFYGLKPFSMSFQDIGYAVSLRGLQKYGRCLPEESLSSLGIDLLITDAWGIDVSGNRLGDGEGFFDLSHAILEEYNALSKEAFVLAVVASRQLLDFEFDHDPWDVPVAGALSENGISFFPPALRSCGIVWEMLAIKRVKKISPLWKLTNRRDAVEKKITHRIP